MSTRSTALRSHFAILGLVIALLVAGIAALAPARAYAEDLNLWVAGTQVSPSGGDTQDIFGDGTAVFTVTERDEHNQVFKGTLTLNNFVSTGQAYGDNYTSAIIYSKIPRLTIELIGNNALEPRENMCKYGIYQAELDNELYSPGMVSKLLFAGSGNLAVSSANDNGSTAIYCEGDILFDNSEFTGTLVAQSGGSGYGDAAGIYAQDFIAYSGTIIATGGRSSGNFSNSVGIKAQRAHLGNDSIVIAQGGRSDACSYGICCDYLWSGHSSVVVARAGEVRATNYGLYGSDIDEKRRAIYTAEFDCGNMNIAGKVFWDNGNLAEVDDANYATGLVIVPKSWKDFDPNNSDIVQDGALRTSVYHVTTTGDQFTYNAMNLDLCSSTAVFVDLRETESNPSSFAGMEATNSNLTVTGPGTLVCVGGTCCSGATNSGISARGNFRVEVNEDLGSGTGPKVVAVSGPIRSGTTAGIAMSDEASLYVDAGTVASVGGILYNGGGSSYSYPYSSVGIDGIVMASVWGCVFAVGGQAEGGNSRGINNSVQAMGESNVLGVGDRAWYVMSEGISGNAIAMYNSRVAGVASIAGYNESVNNLSVGIAGSIDLWPEAKMVALGGLIESTSKGGSYGLLFGEGYNVQLNGSLIAAGRDKAMHEPTGQGKLWIGRTMTEWTGWTDYEGITGGTQFGTLTTFADLAGFKRIETVSELIAYPLRVAGNQVTNENAHDILRDGTGDYGSVRYDPYDNTLYLNNASIGPDDDGWAVVYTGYEPLNIQVYGTCTMTGGDGYHETVNALSADAVDVSINLNDGASLQIAGGNTSMADNSAAVRVDSLDVSGKGTLTVSGDSATCNSVGIWVDSISIDGACEVVSCGGTCGSDCYSAGLVVGGSIMMSGSAKATFEGVTNGVIVDYVASDCVLTAASWWGSMEFVGAGANARGIGKLDDDDEDVTFTHSPEQCTMTGLTGDAFTLYGSASDRIADITNPKIVFEPVKLPFTDVEGHWVIDDGAAHENWLAYVYLNGLMNGYAKTFAYEDGVLVRAQFGPDDELSRAMVATILYRATPDVDPTLSTDPAKYTDDRTGFSDAVSGEWYTEPLNWAKENEIFKGDAGTGYTTVRPNAGISRQELATVFYRWATGVMGASATGADASSYEGMTGADLVAEWAEPGMGWCFYNGVIGGIGGVDLAPEGGATRAMMAKMITVVVRDVI